MVKIPPQVSVPVSVHPNAGTYQIPPGYSFKADVGRPKREPRGKPWHGRTPAAARTGRAGRAGVREATWDLTGRRGGRTEPWDLTGEPGSDVVTRGSSRVC